MRSLVFDLLPLCLVLLVARLPLLASAPSYDDLWAHWRLALSSASSSATASGSTAAVALQGPITVIGGCALTGIERVVKYVRASDHL